MASSQLKPNLLKGAIVAVDVKTSKTTTIAFQYNPQTVTRSLTPKMDMEEPRAQSLHFQGAPEETFTLKIMLDAADQLEAGNKTALRKGIHPQLAALEALIYPQSKQVTEIAKRLKKGEIEVGMRYDAPLTLFVWGPARVLPVMINSFSITEEIFDVKLNPIRAEIDISLRALSYNDLHPDHKGHKLFLTYQKNKESLAKDGITGNANKVVGFDVSGRVR